MREFFPVGQFRMGLLEPRGNDLVRGRVGQMELVEQMPMRFVEKKPHGFVAKVGPVVELRNRIDEFECGPARLVFQRKDGAKPDEG